MAEAPPTGSAAAGRLGSAGAGAVLIGLALWIAFSNLSRPTLNGWIFWIPVTLCLLVMGGLYWWATLSGRYATRASWRAGWILGGVGLAVGVVGPLALNPKANLGPLLGILVTGPLGFVVGVLGARIIQALRGSGDRVS